MQLLPLRPMGHDMTCTRCQAIAILKALLAAIIALETSASHADDWPHWRGPQRNDVAGESSHWKEGAWPPRGAAWSKNVGLGCTSPLVVDGHLFVLGSDRRQDTLFCLDAATGKEKWKVSYACPLYGRHSDGDKNFYAGPSSTPEFDATTGLLYTLSIDGDLNCWDTRSRGRRVWGLNLYDEFRAAMRPRVGRSGRRDYGYTSSPLLHGEALIVEVGSSQGNLIAFDKRSRKRLWASQAKDPAGHNGGPTPITVDGVPCAAVLHHHGLLVVRLDEPRPGETVAEYSWTTNFANNIATPTVHGQHVLLTSGYNHGTICKLHVTLRGARKLWETEEHSKACSPIVYEGHVYWAWQDLHCLDWETGQTRWKWPGRLSDPGSCIATSDGRLIIWAASGRLILAETAQRASRQPKILADREGVLHDDAWPHVVLADGRLFCKDKLGNIKCFELDSKSGGVKK
jgi:outer membrane protein assembly factor BamB